MSMSLTAFNVLRVSTIEHAKCNLGNLNYFEEIYVCAWFGLHHIINVILLQFSLSILSILLTLYATPLAKQ